MPEGRGRVALAIDKFNPPTYSQFVISSATVPQLVAKADPYRVLLVFSGIYANPGGDLCYLSTDPTKLSLTPPQFAFAFGSNISPPPPLPWTAYGAMVCRDWYAVLGSGTFKLNVMEQQFFD